MRVSPVAAGSVAQAAAARQAPPTREVAARRTPLTPAQIRAALGDAHRALGKPASPALLDVLTAQVSLETARGDRMFNFNFGGIKGAGTDGTARYMTREVLAGGEKKLVDGFRAYKSAAEGARDFVQLLDRRYGPALQAAERGDVDGFATELKRRGYYTASTESYAAGLRGLVGNPAPATAQAPAAAIAAGIAVGEAPVAGLPTTMCVARILDAVATQTARLAAPEEENILKGTSA